jgi:hypothetical protein
MALQVPELSAVCGRHKKWGNGKWSSATAKYQILPVDGKIDDRNATHALDGT